MQGWPEGVVVWCRLSFGKSFCSAMHCPAHCVVATGHTPPYFPALFRVILLFRCVAAGLKVECTAVERPGVDLDAVRALAESLKASFRSRTFTK